MTRVAFDTPVQFYAPSATVDELKRKAERERRTVSEIIRTALRRELEAAAICSSD